MAVVEFINPKKFKNQNLKRVLEYIQRKDKTNDSLIFNKDCMKESSYDEFMTVKEAWNKTGGRKYMHFTQSFSPDDPVTPEIAYAIGQRLLKHPQFKDFQVVMAVHTDQKHLHTHFVLNSVSFVDGRKYQQSDKDLQSIKDLSDKLCVEHGLSVIEKKERDKRQGRGEYRAASKGISWKMKLTNAIDNAIMGAATKGDFIRLMKGQGYEVKWTDTRKNITYTTPDGLKCRDDRLGSDQYIKAAMETLFDNPELLARRKSSQDRIEAEFKDFFSLLLGENKPKTLLERLKSLNPLYVGNEFDSAFVGEIADEITELLKSLPAQKRYYYNRLEQGSRDAIDRIAEKIMFENEKIRIAITEYVQTVIEQTREYTENEEAEKEAEIEAYERSYKKVAERILLTVEQFRQFEQERRFEEYRREMAFGLCIDILYMLGNMSSDLEQRSTDYHSELSKQAKIELSKAMEGRGLDWEHDI